MAVVTDARSPALRQAFYRAWTTRAATTGPSPAKFDNTQVMEDLLRLRHEAAQLLGYPNYAAYALARRMARSVDEVIKFLRDMAAAARPAAMRELAELEAFAGRKLDAWDITYYSERLQEERYSVSQEELRPYFALPRVLEGLFGVIQRAVRRELPPAQRRGAVACGCALLRHPRCRRQADRRLLPRPLCTPEQAQRRVDGRLRRPQGHLHRAARCRWRTWSATRCPAPKASTRNSRTTTW